MGELDILCQGTECCIRGFIELRQKVALYFVDGCPVLHRLQALP